MLHQISIKLKNKKSRAFFRALLSSGTFGEFDRKISEQIEHWQSRHLQNGDTCIRGVEKIFHFLSFY